MQHLNLDMHAANLSLLSTVDLAKEARRKCAKKDVYVAAAVGPYYGPLRSKILGTEYDPEYLNRLSVQEIYDWHEPRVQLLSKV